MNLLKRLFLILCLALPVGASAQLVYHDASILPLLGKATKVTQDRYVRLPDSLQNQVRKELTGLGQNSAGMALRFRTNSTCIKARWTVRNNFGMAHMTQIGVKGVDLYGWDDGAWYFAGSGFPKGKQSESMLVKNMSPEMREYLLYLPLYDGALQVEIGIDSLATLEQPLLDLPRQDKPLVFYGTSILQGGCANRPGMAHTNILSRWLQRECINLGFSGNARLDIEVARVMAATDASLYVLDFLPNVTLEQMKQRIDAFYTLLRQAHPEVPILFVENPPFPHGRFNTEVAREVAEENAWLRQYVKRLRRAGDKHVSLFTSEKMIGKDGEATVDGCHFTDLGFMRYAEQLFPVLKKLLK